MFVLKDPREFSPHRESSEFSPGEEVSYVLANLLSMSVRSLGLHGINGFSDYMDN